MRWPRRPRGGGRDSADSSTSAVDPRNEDRPGTRAGPVARQPLFLKRALAVDGYARFTKERAPAVRHPRSPRVVLIQRIPPLKPPAQCDARPDEHERRVIAHQ